MKYTAILLALSLAALAQQPPTLREGTEVKLKFDDSISSKTAALDDPVSLTVTDDVQANGVTVIHAGDHAVAYVSKVQHSGMMGRPGELSIRLDSLKDNGTKVHLRGSKGREGDGKVGETVVLTVLFGPIGLIKHGKNIEINAGSPLTAYVSDDVVFPAATATAVAGSSK